MTRTTTGRDGGITTGETKMGFAVHTDMDNSTLDFVVFATREEAERAANTIKSMASNDRRFDVYETTDPVNTTFADWNCETDDESLEVDVDFHDANPNANSGSKFASETIEAANWDHVQDEIRASLARQAAGLSKDMGYDVGDVIYATWEGEGGCYQEIRHTLTEGDLGGLSENEDGISESSDAYNTGFEAAIKGESLKDNPYAGGTWEAKNWEAGWWAK